MKLLTHVKKPVKILTFSFLEDTYILYVINTALGYLTTCITQQHQQ